MKIATVTIRSWPRPENNGKTKESKKGRGSNPFLFAKTTRHVLFELVKVQKKHRVNLVASCDVCCDILVSCSMAQLLGIIRSRPSCHGPRIRQ
jgi:hypothetical protein